MAHSTTQYARRSLLSKYNTVSRYTCEVDAVDSNNRTATTFGEHLQRRKVAAGAACTPLQCTGYGPYLNYVL